MPPSAARQASARARCAMATRLCRSSSTRARANTSEGIFKMRWLLSAFLLAFSSQCFADPTQIQYLSGIDKDHRVDWDFQVNGGRNAGVWKKIPVPSNWEMEGFGSYRYSNDWQ